MSKRQRIGWYKKFQDHDFEVNKKRVKDLRKSLETQKAVEAAEAVSSARYQKQMIDPKTALSG